jgi:hypothetical protein
MDELLRVEFLEKSGYLDKDIGKHNLPHFFTLEHGPYYNKGVAENGDVLDPLISCYTNNFPKGIGFNKIVRDKS